MRSAGAIKPAPKRKRNYNTRLLKATWPYTVQEIAALYGIHKNAPLRWIKEGMPADKVGNEYLIPGRKIAHFLNERQKSKKRKCRFSEFFCFKCREAREAYMGIVDVIIKNAKCLCVRGICAECNTTLRKLQGVRKLPEIQKTFHVQQLEGLHLIDSYQPSESSDLEQQ